MTFKFSYRFCSQVGDKITSFLFAGGAYLQTQSLLTGPWGAHFVGREGYARWEGPGIQGVQVSECISHLKKTPSASNIC